MSRTRATPWLLLLVVPVWAVGTCRSMKVRENQIKPRSAHAWHARYAKLRPHLEGVPRVAIVHDPRDQIQGKKRLFQAQYVLSPIVVTMPGKRRPIQRSKVPLIFDFKKQRRLDEALAEMSATAAKGEVTVEAVQIGKGLALVKMKRLEQG